MGKEAVTQVQEAQRAPVKINRRRNMLRHIAVKLTKIKDKDKKEKKRRKINNLTPQEPKIKRTNKQKNF